MLLGFAVRSTTDNTLIATASKVLLASVVAVFAHRAGEAATDGARIGTT